MLQVHPKSPYHHRMGRLRPLFTGEWRQEGIWLPRLLTEAALQAEGRCQRLRQRRVPHLGTASFFFFFPAVFAPAFALVCWGKPRPCGHRTPTPSCEGFNPFPHAWRVSRCFLATC